jgi:hypothetical protein
MLKMKLYGLLAVLCLTALLSGCGPVRREERREDRRHDRRRRMDPPAAEPTPIRPEDFGTVIPPRAKPAEDQK